MDLCYLSAGTTMTPAEKLKKYFGLSINRKLFKDAMDVIVLAIVDAPKVSFVHGHRLAFMQLCNPLLYIVKW
jgi:hypothetical protein